MGSTRIQYYEEGEINHLEYLKLISFKFVPTTFYNLKLLLYILKVLYFDTNNNNFY